MRAHYSAQRLMNAPASVVYHCIADYRHHHRPDGFLPAAFSDLEVSRGGVGAGTEVRWVVDAGGRRRTIAATVSEPAPGRQLVETAPGVETTFTVEEQDGGTLVRFDTVFDEPGLQGLLNRMFLARILRPIYDEELRRLDDYARAHGPLEH